MRSPPSPLRALAARATLASALLSAAFVPPAWAGPTYNFAGLVTGVPAALTGPGGLAVGDPVRLSFTLGAPVSDIDSSASAAWWAGAVESWTLSVGAFAASGAGGDAFVCDYPAGNPANCGSANSYPFFGNPDYIGKDAVRFVGMGLASPPIVINGFTQTCGTAPAAQCANANVYDDLARLAGTAIPDVLDPAIFASSANNGRIPFPGGVVTYSVAAVPEPATLALLALGVAGLARTRRYRVAACASEGSRSAAGSAASACTRA